MKRFFVIAALILLTSCTKYVWMKPSGDPSTYGKDNYKCKQEAIHLAPPAFQVREASNRPYKHKKTVATHCSKDKNSKKCLKTVENKEYKPSEYTVDLNKSTRRDLFRACMQSKGWVWTPVEEE